VPRRPRRYNQDRGIAVRGPLATYENRTSRDTGRVPAKHIISRHSIGRMCAHPAGWVVPLLLLARAAAVAGWDGCGMCPYCGSNNPGQFRCEPQAINAGCGLLTGCSGDAEGHVPRGKKQAFGCIDGYVAGGNAQYTCTNRKKGHRWEGGSLTCTPVTCPAAAPAGPHATGCPEGTFGSSTCDVACDSGYIGAGDGRWSCSANRLWTGGNLSCQCKWLGQPATHGAANCKSDPCEATCAHGYRTGPGDATYTCGADGWTGGSLECLPDCRQQQDMCQHGGVCQTDGRCRCQKPAQNAADSNNSWFGNLCERKCTAAMCQHRGVCVALPLQPPMPVMQPTAGGVRGGLSKNTRSSRALAPPPATDFSCNCSDGWVGLDCSVNGNGLCDLSGCGNVDPHAKCQLSTTNTLGYTCTCSPRYEALYEGKRVSCVLADGNGGSLSNWHIAAACATVLSVLAVPLILKKFKKRLENVTAPMPTFRLGEGQDAMGIFGLMMFFFGLTDLMVDLGLCFALASCGQTLLLWCALVTLVNTTILTWWLGYSTLREIMLYSPDARQWTTQHPTMGPLIVLASSSNLSSMAILRLRLCGRMLVDFPDSDDHRFFHFLRHAGLYHYVVEDIPHILISLALLRAPKLEGFASCVEGGGQSKVIDLPGNRSFELPLTDNDIAWLSLVSSLLSISFGIVSKAMQQLSVTVARRSMLLGAPGAGGVSVQVQMSSAEPGTLPDGLRPSIADAVSKLAENGFCFTSIGTPKSAREQLLGGERIGGSE
jgi:hypothetical protein